MTAPVSPALLAVDGGGSKIDAALLDPDGRVLGAARVGSNGYERPGDDGHLSQIDEAARAAVADAGLEPSTRPMCALGVFCLAGADLPSDDAVLSSGIERYGWTDHHELRNDTFAVLRAGTDRDWGVGLVCGSGTNCTAVHPDGTLFRFPAMGTFSGDWGGGHELGELAMWHAVRAEDGRGRETSLRRLVPAHFGVATPRDLLEAFHLETIDPGRLVELPPLLFQAASEGDDVARALVDRQADEIVLMVGTAIRRLRMTSMDPDVVLGGGILRNPERAFHDRIEAGIAEACPAATVRALDAPPVIGAVMLGLDLLGATPAAHRRVRDELTHDRLTAPLTLERTAPQTSARRKEP